MKEYLSFVTIDVWTLIFTWANLFILYLLMKKLLFKPVMNILSRREQEIAEVYDSASSARKEAEAFKSEYETKLSEAKLEARRIITDAAKNAETDKEEIIKDAQTKAKLILNRAEEDIKNEQKAAFDEIKNEVSDMAILLASKIIERDIDERAHHEMIKEFIDSTGEAS